MHEHDLISRVVETLQSLSGDEEIRSVEIALGSGADEAQAAQAWDSLTEGTSLAPAHVTWEQASDLLRCDDCGHEYPGDPLEACPYCGADGVVIESAPPVSLGHWDVAAA